MSQAHNEQTMTKAQIYKVFFILLAITIVEFIVALAIPESMMPRGIKNAIYGVLTLLKAGYIVAFFMHLKFEKITMIYCILVPLVFIVGIVLALTYEANYWLEIR